MKSAAVFLLALSASLLAVSAADIADLARLRDSHKAAIEKATAPVTQTYLKELQKLRDVYTKASNLDAANRVQTEIDAIGLAASAAGTPGKLPGRAPSPPPGDAPRTLATPEPAWIVGKAWVSDSGTRWVFSKGGAGEKSFGANGTAFSWRVLDSGLVEILGKDSNAPDARPRTWYVQFKNASEALYGDSPAKLTHGMHCK